MAGELDIARLAVDPGADVVLVPIFGAASLLDGLLHGFEHMLLVDILLAGDRVGYLKQFHPGEPCLLS